MKVKFIAILAFLLLSFSQAFATQTPEEDVSKARLLLSKYRWIQMHYFLQAGMENNFNEDALETDFLVKRNRVIFNGQTAEKFYFFVQTDDFGSDNTNNTTVYTQDAYLNYQITDNQQLYVGLMAVPFSRQNLSSAASTLTANTQTICNTDGYGINGRDTGLMYRGFFIDGVIEYRFGLFRGLGREEIVSEVSEDETETYVRNKNSIPRISQRVQFNIMEKERGFYYSDNYIGKRKVFAIGISTDFQPNVDQKGDKFKNYFGLAVDFDIQNSLGGGNAFLIEGGTVYQYNHPTACDEDTVEDLNYHNILTFYAQSGLLIADEFQPYGRWTFVNKIDAQGDSNGYYEMDLSFGCNYFFDGHHASARTQFDLPVSDSAEQDNEYKLSTTMQIYL